MTIAAWLMGKPEHLLRPLVTSVYAGGWHIHFQSVQGTLLHTHQECQAMIPTVESTLTGRTW